MIGHDEPAERTTHISVPKLAYRSKAARRPRPGRYVMHAGKLVHVKDLPSRRAVARKDDAHDIRSFGSGCAPEQVDEFNALFGHLGVNYERQTGDAIYDDRPAKLRVLRERGYVDNDEIRGGANIPR